MQVNQQAKIKESKYGVVKDFILYGKHWRAPLYLYDNLGMPIKALKINVISLNWEDAKHLYWRGFITDDLPALINGKCIHPEDRRYNKWQHLARIQ